MRKLIFLLRLLLLVVVVISLIPTRTVAAAGSITKADMIAMMNTWRANYWTNALVEDYNLNACAQSTADEMARIDAGDHLSYLGYPDPSTRCANSFGVGGGSAIRVTENWASFFNGSISDLAKAWDDSDHMRPAWDGQYHFVGVGISTAADGSQYYVLQAAWIDGQSASSASSGSSSSQSDTGQPPVYRVNQFPTSTPNLYGEIWHKVVSGDTLETIAIVYGVTIDQIKTLNNMTGVDIYPGNLLKISLQPTPTLTPTRTATVMLPTYTPTQTPLPVTPTPFPSRTPTPTGDDGRNAQIDRQWLGFGLLVLSAFGFFVVMFFLFLKPLIKNPKSDKVVSKDQSDS